MKAETFFAREAERQTWSHAYLLIGSDEPKIDSLINFVISTRKFQPEDIIRVEPSSESGRSGETKVDVIREMIRQIHLAGFRGGRLAILKSCEKLNQSSANTLLKVLEEPPRNVMLILISASDNILDTIRSRCRVVKVGSTNNALDYSQVEALACEEFSTVSREIEKIVKEEAVNEFIDQLLAYERACMLEQYKTEWSQMVAKTLAAKAAIFGNANARLALENLMIQLRKLVVESKVA